MASRAKNASSWAWHSRTVSNGATTLGSNFSGVPFGGAQVDTDGLGLGFDTNNLTTDTEEELALFTIGNPFPTANASYVVSFDIVEHAMRHRPHQQAGETRRHAEVIQHRHNDETTVVGSKGTTKLNKFADKSSSSDNLNLA